MTVPPSLALIAKRVDERITVLMDTELARWSLIDTDLVAPLSSLRSLVLAGGKRLRPAFCHWAYVGVGGDPEDTSLVDAGAGLELLHTFALVHDDVMDGSRTRRGMDAVHIQFIDAHHEFSGRGEDRRFGEGVAILVGDLAFVYADILLNGANAEAIRIFNELRIEVNIGQYLDLLGSVRGEPSIESARRICQYKSGKYTIERPLHLGAALGGRLASVEGALTAYGMPLGEAFQLRDDLLGTIGDDQLTGKPVGDDLREGKPTALIAEARKSATPPQRQLLTQIGDPNLSDAAIIEMQGVLHATGAVARIEQRIEELRNESIEAIASATMTTESLEALVELAHFVTSRDY
jgi:geranylgeranyl diphosphate synthase, type I